jgi:hypothetical protein
MKRIASGLALIATATLLVGAAPALAAHNGNHGHSGTHGNSGGNGNPGNNGNAFGRVGLTASVGAGNAGANANASGRDVVALAGTGNAAHASIQGLLHANPRSAVGRVKAYADLNFQAQQQDQATAQSLSSCNAALAGDSNTASLGGDCSLVTLADLQDAGASQTTITAFNAYLSDKASSDTADASAKDALLAVTRNGSNPQVKSYIDGLLGKYYNYLAAN